MPSAFGGALLTLPPDFPVLHDFWSIIFVSTLFVSGETFYNHNADKF